jgi:hypothetical protein
MLLDVLVAAAQAGGQSSVQRAVTGDVGTPVAAAAEQQCQQQYGMCADAATAAAQQQSRG